MSKSKKFSFNSLVHDKRGNVAVIFGAMAIPMFGTIGASVDYARALRVKSQLQSIADAGAMAGLRKYRTTGDVEAGQRKMREFIDEGLKQVNMARAGSLAAQVAQEDPNSDVKIVTLTGDTIQTSDSTSHPTLTTQIDTPFLTLIGVQGMEVSGSAIAALADTQERGTKALELSLMLDVSGSMADNNKLEDMKDAAQDFLTIVMPDDLEVQNRRVGLIPFSDRVNVGSFAPAATGLPATRQVQTGTTNTYVFSTTSFSYMSLTSCGTRVRSITAHANLSTSASQAYCQANFTTRRVNNQTQYYTPARVTVVNPVYSTYNLRTCVTERQGTDAYEETAPQNGSYIGWYNPTSGESSQYSSSGGCSIPAIKTLTTERQELSDYIETFQTYSGTAGHVGTAWSWYMLSPEWNSFWSGSQEPVEAYTETETVKAAVIMTDGQYNSNYASASASQQAIEICTKMKAQGIKVYTIGFDMSTNVNDPARQTLMQCASPNKYYFPYNGQQLRQAFQEIGNSLVNIVHISSDDETVIIQE